MQYFIFIFYLILLFFFRDIGPKAIGARGFPRRGSPRFELGHVPNWQLCVSTGDAACIGMICMPRNLDLWLFILLK